MFWTVFLSGEDEYKKILAAYGSQLNDRMCIVDPGDPQASGIASAVSAWSVVTEGKEAAPAVHRKLTVKERLREPHIVSEMLRIASGLSSKAQSDFLAVLEGIASSFRDLMLNGGLIRSVEIDHKSLWSDVDGRTIGFIDGGSANLASIGAEPVAIRVGSFVVTPGRTSDDRESFRIERQLVDELFDSGGGSGVFDDQFEDMSKLRDVARICLETGGAIAALERKPTPEFLFLHGALVNPVSSYALDGFPNFSAAGSRTLLPGIAFDGDPRERNFVNVYLRQIEALRGSGATVCGVVERASPSRILTQHLIQVLKKLDVSPGSSVLEAAWEKLREYRISMPCFFTASLTKGSIWSHWRLIATIPEGRRRHGRQSSRNTQSPRSHI